MSQVAAVFRGATLVQSVRTLYSNIEQVAIRIGRIFENVVCEALGYISSFCMLIAKKVVVFIAQSSIWVTFTMKGSDAVIKSKEIQIKLDALTKSVHCKEAGKYMAAYYTAYVKDTILHALDFDECDRPYWVNILIEKTATGYQYSKEGEIALYAVKNHEKMIQECLEVNVLNMLFSLATSIDTMERKKPETFLNVILELVSKFALHFMCTKSFPYHIKSQKFDYETQTRILLSHVFPKGAESLYLMDLPFVQAQVFDSIKNVLPELFSWSFQSLQSTYLKECCLLNAFQALKDFVNEKHNGIAFGVTEAQPTIQYSRQNELNEVLYHLLTSFMHCVDPESLKDLHRFVKPEDIKLVLGKNVVQALYGRSLFELCNVVVEGMLPTLNKGGLWHEGTSGKKFKAAPFVFIHKRVDFERQAKETAEAEKQLHTQLEKIVQEIGKNADGLVQEAATALGLKKKAASQKQGRSGHYFAEMERFFLKGVSIFETGVEEIELDIKRSFTSFFMRYLAKKIHAVGGQVYITLQQPLHNRMLSHLANEVIQLFQRDQRG